MTFRRPGGNMTQTNLFGKKVNEEDLVEEKKRKPDKVEILIKPNCGPYDESVEIYGGQLFTSVDYNGRIYGGAGSCNSEEEIQNSVAHAKKRIIGEGDIPIVKDLREVTKL